MSRAAAILACLLGMALAATPATAYWRAGGTGTGVAQVADMPTGATPTTAVNGRSVTVTWAQNAFTGGTLGGRGGGYTVARYAEASSTPVTPGAGCSATRAGSADPMTCTEGNVPYGRWVYRITPVLDSFVGTEGPPSDVAAVVLPAPVLTTVKAQNPAAGVANGPVSVTWSAAQGATGYNVFRRISGGAYDLSAPLNGATALTGTTYSDATATNGATYDYVVHAVDSSTAPSTASGVSNERSAKVITRPTAPATATAAAASGSVNVSWDAAASATAGYDVFRRTSAQTSFDFTAPINGASPVTATTYEDTTTVRGTTYVYAVRSVIIGADDARVQSLTEAQTAGASCTAGYAAAIGLNSPSNWYRLGDLVATTAANSGSNTRAGRPTGATAAAAGAPACDANTAFTLNGISGQITQPNQVSAAPGPNTFTIEAWFKTTVAGGKIIGFGNARGPAASTSYDRHLYVDSTGRLVFGVYPNAIKTISSPAAVNDGTWHMATASLGAGGMRLYLDGALVASDPTVTTGEAFSGWWRIGYDNLASWTNQPAGAFFNGALDEIATFGTQLTTAQILAHYTAARP